MENIFTDVNATQINLFDYLKKAGKIQVQKKTYSEKLPERIQNFTGQKHFSDLESLLESFSGIKDTLIYKGNRYINYHSNTSEYYTYIGDTMDGSRFNPRPEWTASLKMLKNSYNVLSICRGKRGEFVGYLLYVTEAGVVYESEMLMKDGGTFGTRDSFAITGITLSKWKKAKLHAHKICTVLNEGEVHDILTRVNPYGADFMTQYNTLEEIDLLIAPQIEQLDKAGYSFVKQALLVSLTGYEDSATLEQFGRLCQPGKNMKEIFKTSKAVYTTLKDCPKLSTWDIYRKMDKQGKVSADNIERCYHNGYSEKELNEVSSILNMEYDGKKVFTWDSLQRYLERIDMYEAIDRMDGLMLLKDYLSMCSQLEMKPRIDGDSLKREHDVTARTLRQKRDEIRAGKMVGVCEEIKKYDYSEHVYFGRCIRSYDDLIDEATQQHNCVASYADSIISKRSYIFVVREVSAPDKSLATVELTPQGDVRQKYLAYNRTIHNKALTDFIDRLSRNFKGVKNAVMAA